MSSCKVVIQIFQYNALRLLKYFVDTLTAKCATDTFTLSLCNINCPE